MPKVVVKENEVLDDALRRFKRQVSRNGTLAEARKREFYVKPGVRRKLKSEVVVNSQKVRGKFGLFLYTFINSLRFAYFIQR